MRKFRRKLVMTPLLLAMALVALGLPASAQEVYEQNSSQACCKDQTCSATQAGEAPCGVEDQGCGSDECVSVALAHCALPEREDPSSCAAGCDTDVSGRSCVPAQGCCNGARSALGCCP
jgi:hypothetical protein